MSVVCVAILLVVCSFAMGVQWKKYTLGQASKVVLTTALTIQVPGNEGILPKGTVLYRYKELPEITTYYMFVNLKERNVTTQYAGVEKFNLIAPVDAYSNEQ